MKLGVMQPYIFPYIGYFQLINTVDKFVFYDDVNFIKQGWINRNKILLNGKDFLFTVPLADASSFKKINEIEINTALYDKWKLKFLKTLDLAYSKAPYYKQVFPIVDTCLSQLSKNIGELASSSVSAVIKYIGLNVELVYTSSIYQNDNLKGQDRIINICQKEKATEYINAIGGMELYDHTVFNEYNISLKFIKAEKISYRQFGENFVPALSIIDVLMFNSVDCIKVMLGNRTLV